MTTRLELGFGPFFSQQYDRLDRSDLVPARVASETRGLWSLLGCRAALGELSGRLRHALAGIERPVVGDWVVVADHGERAVIHHVLARSSAMVRRLAGKTGAAQIIAANVDLFFIVTAATRDFNVRRLERYLTAVWDSGAQPVVLLNKVDLCPRSTDMVTAIHEVAASVPVVCVSALTGVGIEDVRRRLSGNATAAFIGSSGVGKSSLTNSLMGSTLQTVDDVRADGKGRHATTRRELLPLRGGGVVIDTPGMRELGLIDDEGGIERVFRDVADFATQCRYRDCGHENTPGCAVEAAIADGGLDADRLDAYRKIEREIAAAARRHDPRLASNSKRRSKEISRATRARTKAERRWRE